MVQASAGPVIVWFRRDLRLADNPALSAAVETGRPVLPVYILDRGLGRSPGAASLWWLDKSLKALDQSLKALGSGLIVRRGDSLQGLRQLIGESGAEALYLNRLFEPDAAATEAAIAEALKADGLEVRGFNATLLARPGTILSGSGTPYRVFTPFMKALWQQAAPPRPRPAPQALPPLPGRLDSLSIDALGLHPRHPDWSTGFDLWTPGEAGARARLDAFLDGPVRDYPTARDIPGVEGTSRLSPHLHLGEISPWAVVTAAREAAEHGRVGYAAAEKFAAEVAWREFSAHLLDQAPELAERNFRPEFDRFPWRSDAAALAAWQRGQTGYPIVDAGMRELWTTGWMHNRVRMIVASFLIKHLLIDWREGEAWFWDTLVDADHASNAQNWQWTAGSGADAAPYFRIYNPISQGEKFDPRGAYVRRWVPEIATLPDEVLHRPWTASDDQRRRAGIELGRTYPHPIVDHGMARQRALDALATLKS